MLIDTLTLVLFAATTNCAVALAMLFAVKATDPGLRRSLEVWTAGVSVQALGWLLLGTRGALPDWVAYVLANSLICLGLVICVQALLQFSDRPVRKWPFLLAALSLFSSYWFTEISPEPVARMAVNTVLLAAVYLLGMESAWSAFRGRQRPRSDWLLIAVFALAAGLLLARLPWLWIINEPIPIATVHGIPMWQLPFAAVLVVAPVIATLAFSLMCNDRLSARLETMALTDPLTGLLNRRCVEQRGASAMAQAQAAKQPLSVLELDVDHFKKINDSAGHAVGDQALRMLAAALRELARGSDSAGRIGGEEFVLLLPGADLAGAALIAERLRCAVAKLHVANCEVPLRVSIGVAQLQAGDRHFGDLLRRADQALYAAKDQGRDRVVSAEQKAVPDSR